MNFFVKCMFMILSWNSNAKFLGVSKKHSIVPTIDLPDGLVFGAGTSAFQVEGALKTHGKSESFIETYVSQKYPNLQDSPDVSSDSYHRFKEDVKVLKYIGLKFYRFSMSWPRMLPTGYTDHVNQEGVDYYHALLDELEKAGIEPMVQINHLDHPAAFEKFGGWQNESMIDLFKDYSRFIFKEFGHRVKYFLTFNEPNLFCNLVEQKTAMTIENDTKSTFPRPYICSNNILKAHAEVYHLYHDEFNSDKKGKISMNLLCYEYIAEEEKDQYLVDIAFAFGCGWFAHPIFSKSGDYSNTLKERVKETNVLRGQEKLELPTFSEYWIKRIRGSADFFAFSYYSTRIVKDAPTNDPKSWINFYFVPEARLILKASPLWLSTADNKYIVPNGLRSILKKIKNHYNNPPVRVVENGISDDGRLNDTGRIKFIYAHVKQIVDAINNDHCNVEAYTYWSLIDNFEFWFGYSSHYGLIHIDFDSPNRTRTPKESAKWLRNVLLKRQLYIEE